MAKRLLDVLGAIIGLIIFTPVYLCVAVLIAVCMGGPLFHRRRVLEKQTYDPARLPRTFDAFKFRTMISNAEAVLQADGELRSRYEKEWKLLDDPRVTPLGRVLRKWSLDELPQFINVLRGQMSLVGPRMISPPELTMYGPHAAVLLSVKPGLTGLWQVSGRTSLTYRERVRLDVWYIQHRSFLAGRADTFGHAENRRKPKGRDLNRPAAAPRFPRRGVCCRACVFGTVRFSFFIYHAIGNGGQVDALRTRYDSSRPLFRANRTLGNPCFCARF